MRPRPLPGRWQADAQAGAGRLRRRRRHGHQPAGAGPDGTRPRAKPPVRKLAADLHVDLASLTPGSGPDGMITREDVLAAAGTSATDSDDVDVHGVQATMAQRMTLSRSKIPDAHASVQVDCSALLRVRDRLRDAVGDDGPPITPFVLTLRLLTIALTHHPMFNSTWVDTAGRPAHPRPLRRAPGIRRSRRRAGCWCRWSRTRRTSRRGSWRRRCRGSSSEARAGTVKPAELQGSTFTVSNFGALGFDEGVPVINYPEAAILGMGSLKPRPVVVDDAVVARPTMTLTCAFDHRIADGAQVAAFLGELRD